jgi:hypothetical protein
MSFGNRCSSEAPCATKPYYTLIEVSVSVRQRTEARSMADNYATVHEHDLVGGKTRACFDDSIEIEMRRMRSSRRSSTIPAGSRCPITSVSLGNSAATARSTASTISCPSCTETWPSTSRWNSTKTRSPASRVRRSCMPRAPGDAAPGADQGHRLQGRELRRLRDARMLVQAVFVAKQLFDGALRQVHVALGHRNRNSRRRRRWLVR